MFRTVRPDHSLGRMRTALAGVVCALMLCAPATLAADEVGHSAAIGSDLSPRRYRPELPVMHDVHPHVGKRAITPGQDVQLPSFDVQPLLDEDEQWRGVSGIPRRIGINRPLHDDPISSETAGVWTTRNDGINLWTLRVHVPQAKAIRIHFSRFDLPETGQLLLAGQARVSADKYTGRGPLDNGTFWTSLVSGSICYLEYQAPPDQVEQPVIEIDEVSHIYREPVRPGKTSSIENETMQLMGTPELGCHEDVNCHSVDPTARDAVGMMVFTDGQYMYECSGVLLNDADPKTYAGYFLTANHCLSTQAMVNSLTVYWFYQTDQCDGTVPADIELLPKSTGGTLLATATTTDFTFLRLADDPQDGQGFAAWTTADATGNLATIHHPMGDYKRITYGTPTSAAPICSPPTDYWYLRLNLGAIESGSSGGPLFNENWEVTGQLLGSCFYYGTDPGCDNYTEYNVMFGKFSGSYPAFSTYLNTVTPDDDYEDNDTIAQAVNIEPDTYTLKLIDFDDYFAVTLPLDGDLTAIATFATADMDLDLELLTEAGSPIVDSTGTGPSEMVSNSLTRGTYIVHVIKKHLWGGDYTLEVQAPRFRGDFDLDADVDMDDFAYLQRCLSGPTTEQTDPDCAKALLDPDLDVDYADVQLFIECLAGPYVTPPPACGP